MPRKPGRNDPCPCGSGKKHKHCCLQTSGITSTDPRMMTWTRLRRLLGDFSPAMLEFTLRSYGTYALRDAWCEFVAVDGAEFDPDASDLELFFPWLYHWWTPDPRGENPYPLELHEVEPSRLWLDRHGGQAHRLLRQYLECCLAMHFSFHQVESVDPGKGLTVVDLLTDARHDILEATLSRSVEPGMIMFGAVVETEGMALIEGFGGTALEPLDKLAIIDQREAYRSRGIELTREGLREHADDLIHLYQQLAADDTSHMPEIYNSDDEHMVPQRLLFELDDSEAAFAALAHLDVDSTPDDIEGRVEFDRKGRFEWAWLNWTAPGTAQNAARSGTVLGQLDFEDGHLKVEVNSDQRATQLRELIEAALGDAVRFKSVEKESLEAALAEMGEPSEDNDESFSEIDDSPPNPEELARLKEIVEAHYATWHDQPLPSLDGQTPLEAVKTKVGRERVEVLLEDLELANEAMELGSDPALFQRMRQRVGIE